MTLLKALKRKGMGKKGLEYFGDFAAGVLIFVLVVLVVYIFINAQPRNQEILFNENIAEFKLDQDLLYYLNTESSEGKKFYEYMILLEEKRSYNRFRSESTLYFDEVYGDDNWAIFVECPGTTYHPLGNPSVGSTTVKSGGELTQVKAKVRRASTEVIGPSNVCKISLITKWFI